MSSYHSTVRVQTCLKVLETFGSWYLCQEYFTSLMHKFVQGHCLSSVVRETVRKSLKLYVEF